MACRSWKDAGRWIFLARPVWHCYNSNFKLQGKEEVFRGNPWGEGVVMHFFWSLTYNTARLLSVCARKGQQWLGLDREEANLAARHRMS